MNQSITATINNIQPNSNKNTIHNCELCTLAQVKHRVNKLQTCICTPLQLQFVASKPSAVLFRGLIANNPNNPGISLKEGTLSYSEIQGIPLADVCKVKLCLRNEFMLINTLQIYSSHNENKPVCLGVDSIEGSQWLLSLIQAQLILQSQINIGSHRPSADKVTGILFKKSVFGKWKMHQATCVTLPPQKSLKLSEEYSVINSTSEVWTRFQRVELKGVECLVVKLWGTLGKKQLGIPLGQLALWLRAICCLLS